MKILHQVEDVLDVLRVVAPPRLYQYIAYYDNSATHNKREDMTLSTSKLNAKWGGKQAGLRDSVLVEGCIGPNVAIMWYLPGQGTGEWEGGPRWVLEGTAGSVAFDCSLKVGDIDTGKFRDTDPPPFYDLQAQRFDRDMTAIEVIAERARSNPVIATTTCRFPVTLIHAYVSHLTSRNTITHVNNMCTH